MFFNEIVYCFGVEKLFGIIDEIFEWVNVICVLMMEFNWILLYLVVLVIGGMELGVMILMFVGFWVCEIVFMLFEKIIGLWMNSVYI